MLSSSTTSRRRSAEKGTTSKSATEEFGFSGVIETDNGISLCEQQREGRESRG